MINPLFDPANLLDIRIIFHTIYPSEKKVSNTKSSHVYTYIYTNLDVARKEKGLHVSGEPERRTIRRKFACYCKNYLSLPIRLCTRV